LPDLEVQIPNEQEILQKLFKPEFQSVSLKTGSLVKYNHYFNYCQVKFKINYSFRLFGFLL